MGYYAHTIQQQPDEILIPADKVATFWQAIPQESIEWFSEKLEETAEKAVEFLIGLSFNAYERDGSVVVDFFDGKVFSGHYDHVWQAVAASAANPADWVIVGEDGEIWAECVADGQHTTRGVKLVVER